MHVEWLQHAAGNGNGAEMQREMIGFKVITFTKPALILSWYRTQKGPGAITVVRETGKQRFFERNLLIRVLLLKIKPARLVGDLGHSR